MYLRRLDIQGFKTFANKTVLEFVPDAGARRGLTGVVGPNGSGKSNVADALRWVMGEQSLKLLRSKKSEDVIFSGSDKRARSGFAEVSMVIVNDDKPEMNMSEISITRRLYRDGQSEYAVNGQSARLTDVALLLAECGIGQRTYSVIGQGMADAVLSASPAERKEFFDEAAGLKPFQLKRQSAMNKLGATKENIRQADLVLQELGPRLSSLDRQVKRLREREDVERELKELETRYYGSSFALVEREVARTRERVRSSEAESAARAQEAEKLEAELAALEKATPPSEGFEEIRSALDGLNEDRMRLREEKVRLESARDAARARALTPLPPLPLSKIIEGIGEIQATHDELTALVSEAKPDIDKIRESIERVRKMNASLLQRLQRPAPEPATATVDPEIEKRLAEIDAAIKGIDSQVAATRERMSAWQQTEDGKRTHVFALQHQLTSLRHKAGEAATFLSAATAELARAETRRESLLADIRAHAPHLEERLDGKADEVKVEDNIESLAPRMARLRSQLEWIGGIDPAIIEEYEVTKKRFDELHERSTDLREALQSLETIIAELDQTIAERAATAFQVLDREFGVFFKKLFGGGEAKLIEVAPEPEMDEAGNVIKEVPADAPPVGIEIQATPPGKRLKSIALLSGGERALTSIALICAIMATNPSPFIVLDEVDAALDEANSRKYAEILDDLADRTQFVVITHNRATMHKAHVLYGVTMGDDGVSQILSVKMEGEKTE